MTEETGRLLAAFRAAREKLEHAAAHDELTEALCLLPPAQRAFTTSMAAFRERIAALPGSEGGGSPSPADIPGSCAFLTLPCGHSVTRAALRWFAAGVAAALAVSFVIGFLVAKVH